MQYALAPSGNRILAEPGATGTCPTCDDQLIPKCGPIVVDHWAHRSGPDCDPWSEPESEWHLGWKRALEAAGARTEVTIRRDGQWHRADAVLPNGTVVELQHGYLPVDQIRARENFYGDMVWLYDAHWIDRVTTRGHTLRWRRPAESMVAHRAPVYWHIGAHDPTHTLGRVARVDLRREASRFEDGHPIVVGDWHSYRKEGRFVRELVAPQPCQVCGGPVHASAKIPNRHPACHQWPDTPDALRPYGIAG